MRFAQPFKPVATSQAKHMGLKGNMLLLKQTFPHELQTIHVGWYATLAHCLETTHSGKDKLSPGSSWRRIAKSSSSMIMRPTSRSTQRWRSSCPRCNLSLKVAKCAQTDLIVIFKLLSILRGKLWPVFAVMFHGTCLPIRYALVTLDCCVWPRNSTYLHACVDALSGLLSMSPKHVGHLQLPMPQAQALPNAVLKHRRQLEDKLIANNLDVLRNITLNFDKSNLPAGDQREPLHLCTLVTCNAQDGNAFNDSSAAQSRTIGPCPLIRVADMLGFDAENRPGASQRMEQLLVVFYQLSFWTVIVKSFMSVLLFWFVLLVACQQLGQEGHPSPFGNHFGLLARYELRWEGYCCAGGRIAQQARSSPVESLVKNT